MARYNPQRRRSGSAAWQWIVIGMVLGFGCSVILVFRGTRDRGCQRRPEPCCRMPQPRPRSSSPRRPSRHPHADPYARPHLRPLRASSLKFKPPPPAPPFRRPCKLSNPRSRPPRRPRAAILRRCPVMDRWPVIRASRAPSPIAAKSLKLRVAPSKWAPPSAK